MHIIQIKTKRIIWNLLKVISVTGILSSVA